MYFDAKVPVFDSGRIKRTKIVGSPLSVKVFLVVGKHRVLEQIPGPWSNLTDSVHLYL